MNPPTQRASVPHSQSLWPGAARRMRHLSRLRPDAWAESRAASYFAQLPKVAAVRNHEGSNQARYTRHGREVGAALPDGAARGGREGRREGGREGGTKRWWT